MFNDLLLITHNKDRLAQDEVNHIGQLMENIRQHCEHKQITIPKAIVEPNNEQALNNYIRT
jgi:hypothetical protein